MGAPEKSRSRCMLNSSTAAGTDPSRRKRTFAGGAFGKVSGTSKTPLVIESLRPDDMSTLPRPILITAVRPEMCRLTSASRMAGRPSTGRISPPCPVSWISKPSSGTGGPLDLSVDQGALVEMSMRSIVPAWTWSTTQARTFEATVTGHSRFMAATDMRVLANPSVTRGSSPEKSRLPVSAMPRSVLPTSLGSRSMRCLAGLIRIRSRTRLRTSACGSTGADAPGQRQVGLVLIRVQPHGEHHVFGRKSLCFDIDDAVTLLARRHRRAQVPRPLEAVRAERDRDASPLRSRHAQIDIGKRPLLAIALVVDGEIAALQPDLGELASIEPARAETLDPGDQRGDIRNAAADACGRGWSEGSGRGGRRRPRRCGCALGVCGGADRLRRRWRRGGRSGDKGALVAAGENRELAVRFDAHRHFGADQAQALGADATEEKTHARDADFGLRGAGDDAAVGIAHHYVANAQRHASLLRVTLELGAANLDLVPGTQIFLDRRGQPWGGDIALDRAAGEPPRQRKQREHHRGTQRAADKREFAQPRRPRVQQHSDFAAGRSAQLGWRGASRVGVSLRRCIMRAKVFLEARLKVSESLQT